MSYLVLARKHRPQTFDELIGQEHISELLKKALKSEKVAHSYLFCGPRGIGKTSCARILAKALNCEQGPTIIPCGKCTACQEITKGSSFDVLEIDGASNRGIDEIRALRENVKFAPSYGRFKIYIIDEVHMLTTEAFNALLKTLEEPPEHVKFIFATTEPNKIPATIISRCQRFDFKRVPIKTIVELLEDISEKENLTINEDALYAIGKAAQGSLRDALSILDQLSALSEEGIKTDDVFSMLGLVETEFLFELTDAIAQKNCSLSLQVLEKIIDKGKDIKQLTKDLTEHFRHLMVVKVGGKSLGKLIDYPVVIKEKFLVQCEQFTLKDILQSIDTFIGTQEVARITESIRMPLEVALAKITYQGETAPALPPQQTASTAQVQSNPIPPKLNIPAKNLNPEPKAETSPTVSAMTKSTDLSQIRKVWDTLTHAVSKKKMSLAAYLQEGSPYTLKDNTLTIGFSPKFKFHKESLEDAPNLKLVEDIFTEKLKSPILLKYILIDGDMPQQSEDPAVQSVLETFGGEVVSRWHNE